MSSGKHNPIPPSWIAPDTLAQAAHYDYEEKERLDAEAAVRAAAEKAGEAVGGLRSTGETLHDTAAAAAARAAEAKESVAHTASDLTASAKTSATDAGHRISSVAEEAAERAAAAAAASSEKAHDAQASAGPASSDQGGWAIGVGWQAAQDWGRERWEAWRERPGQWADAASGAAEDWRHRLSWESARTGVEGWQTRHWASFEERAARRLEAMTEEQRETWQLRVAKGQQAVRRELQAFSERQQEWWAAQHPEEAARVRALARAREHQGAPSGKPRQPFLLTHLFLPLLPPIGESLSHFGLRTKMGVVGEMRDAGTRLADTLAAAGEKVGIGGSKK